MRFGVLDVGIQENMTILSAGEAIICSIVGRLMTPLVIARVTCPL